MTTQVNSSSYSDPPTGVAYDTKTGKAVSLAMNLYSVGYAIPEAAAQWHLRYLGDLYSVWQDYTGKGVHVGVYDTGVESAHWDIAPNYDASRQLVDDNGKILSGEPVYTNPDDPTDGAHGTSCAGLIGAALNGRGGVGVAYGVKLTSVNVFDDSSQAFNLAWSIGQAARFDVISNSWGFPGLTEDSTTSRSTDNYYSDICKSIKYIADEGRGGLGTIFVKAAGNSYDDASYDSINLDRHTISVAAYRQVDGVAAYYSCSGPYLLVSSPSNDYTILGGTGLVTTDLLGARGYNQEADPTTPADYTNSFGGTSGATPIVTGVVSLMLDANPELGWRDVRNILAASAKMPIDFNTGPVEFTLALAGKSATIALNERQFQLSGHDADWNGGAMHYSNDYGYGAVDAYSAVRMAEVWSLFAPAKTSVNEVSSSVSERVGLSTSSIGTPIDPTRLQTMNDFVNHPTAFTFQVADSIDLEHVDLTLDYKYLLRVSTVGGNENYPTIATLINSQFKLIAPDGTEAFSVQTPAVNLGQDTEQFMLGFSGFHGVDSKGTWTLEFATWGQTQTYDSGPSTIWNGDLTINSLKMDMYGSTPSNDNVYTYTNEFFKMAAIDGEGARRTLTDTNGGTDWINAAAVSQDIVLSLVGGQTTTFGGKAAFTIDRNTVIENAVTGDGNDTLIGNRFNNVLYGGRGNDILNGGMGDDILSGGTGSNRFIFDARSGHDTIVDWARSDIIQTVKALKGVGSDGILTVGANATLLLDGTADGNTVLLTDESGAKLQSLGKKDGYFWYAYVADAAANAGHQVQEAAYQPGATAAGIVDLIVASTGAAPDHAMPTGADRASTQHDLDSGFFLYSAMAGSMSAGVQLFA